MQSSIKAPIPSSSKPTAFLSIAIYLFAGLLFAGCASVNYVGLEYAPTNNIDVFYSEEAVVYDYELIGHGLGSGFWVRNQKIQNKLIETAKERGADAILITGLGKSNVLIGSGISTDEKQMNVAFLRYK